METIKEYMEAALQENPFTPLWTLVYIYLKREVITLRLAPGDRLIESQLATQMNVSRSPVKRAIAQLEVDGLVEEEETGKTRISLITKKNLQHLAYARLEIDGQAAKIAAKRIRQKELAEMKLLLNQFCCQPEDLSFYNYATMDDRFHKIIYESCGNPYLQSMYGLIRPALLRYRYYSMVIYPDKKELFHSTYICHRAIYEALKNHFSEMAKSEAREDASRMPDTIALIPDAVDYTVFKKLDNSSVIL